MEIRYLNKGFRLECNDCFLPLLTRAASPTAKASIKLLRLWESPHTYGQLGVQRVDDIVTMLMPQTNEVWQGRHTDASSAALIAPMRFGGRDEATPGTGVTGQFLPALRPDGCTNLD